MNGGMRIYLTRLLGNRFERLEHVAKNFDSKKEYPYNPEGKEMTRRTRALEIGRIVKLVDTLTINGCDDDDVWVRVIKHAMVLIDAMKHRLDYEQSFIDHKIGELYKEYGIK